MAIRFPYNPDKATQVILWFLKKHSGKLDKLKLVKLVFFADQKHLFLYGRPIVGGSYFAMPHGPVSSELLDNINSADGNLNHSFVLNGRDIIDNNSDIDENLFSESDLEILKATDDAYGSHDAWTLREETHKLKSYLRNDPESRGRKSLPYEDFFLDSDNSAMLEIVQDEQLAWTDFQ